ncbi:hypothetical protein [Desulfosarcina sp.]|uniref:hypothetical protein n=1 Tax=Desulfosarcina sp. TaxID=2027861 RepID=UPI0035618A25
MKSVLEKNQVAFIPMRSTSPVAMVLDPRSDLQNDVEMNSGRNESFENEVLNIQIKTNELETF